jgi:hypothetical protein
MTKKFFHRFFKVYVIEKYIQTERKADTDTQNPRNHSWPVQISPLFFSLPEKKKTQSS